MLPQLSPAPKGARKRNRPLRCRGRWSVLVLATLALGTPSTQAHPHVFVDGGVDLRFGPDRQLETLEVTWIYDTFETLYMLAAHGMALNDQGTLDEADRLELVKRLSQWPEDFDGSAHLTVDGAPVALKWPSALDVHMIDGRLQLTFERALPVPMDPTGKSIDVAFFESTYFFDFTITNAPKLLGTAPDCAVELIPFDPDSGDKEQLQLLAKLGREETPETANIGEAFADRILVTCA